MLEILKLMVVLVALPALVEKRWLPKNAGIPAHTTKGAGMVAGIAAKWACALKCAQSSHACHSWNASLATNKIFYKGYSSGKRCLFPHKSGFSIGIMIILYNDW